MATTARPATSQTASIPAGPFKSHSAWGASCRTPLGSTRADALDGASARENRLDMIS